MVISILTLFPDMFRGPFDSSIVKRAQNKGLVTINIVNIRDFSTDAYKSVDDRPYGGGTGMIMRVDIIDQALKSVQGQKKGKTRTILLDPQGLPYTQKKARIFAKLDHIILVCGHYEGVDERVRDLVDEEISIGDYVLTGGEIPTLVIVDSITRLVPGVLSKKDATRQESFSESLLEHPQYTRPEVYKTMKVPDVLMSGNHAAIGTWRRQEAKKKTAKRRPDLLKI